MGDEPLREPWLLAAGGAARGYQGGGVPKHGGPARPRLGLELGLGLTDALEALLAMP
jgi:hypothetical protein